MEFIELIELCKYYTIGEYRIIAVDDISQHFDKNDVVHIQGMSGAGKTTLLNLIASLDKPTSGEVIIDGIHISLMKEDALASWRATNVGFIFQSFNLISTLTGRENIIFPALCWEPNSPEIGAKVEELLELVGMADRADHLPVQLSAGEQQRIAIARALVNDPGVIVADEPTANLDAKNAADILDLFENITRSGEKTIIVASHDERFGDIATKRFVMDAGRLIEL